MCVRACVACKCFVCKTCNLILHGPWLSSQRTVGRKQWHGTVASSVNCKQLGSSSLSINRKMLSLTYCKRSRCYCTDISNVSSSINCRHCKTLSINLVFIDLTYTYLCWPTVLLLLRLESCNNEGAAAALCKSLCHLAYGTVAYLFAPNN